MKAFKVRPLPRWFRIIATRTVNYENMQFDAVVEIQVYAESESDAMKKARPEFRNFHLAVQK